MSNAFDPASCVRPELRAIKAYHLERSSVPHKLDQNEMPYELPRCVKRRIAESLVEHPWSLYPDFHGAALRETLGELYDWPSEGVLVGNGSGELLGVVLSACVPAGAEVLGMSPSFSLYTQLVLRAGGVPRFLSAGEDLALPLEALEAEIERDPKRPTILCTPNNPTGEAVAPEIVERLLGKLRAPLLLDAAYLEFCEYDYRPLLERHRHLVIFGTLSKAWALAALRIGYLLADPALVAELVKVKRPYNLNAWSVLVGSALLAEKPPFERRVRTVLGRRPQWAQMLRDFGFEVLPSQANFLLTRHPQAERLETELEERGIRVRKLGGHPALASSLRFSVGSGISLRATRRALTEILGEPS